MRSDCVGTQEIVPDIQLKLTVSRLWFVDDAALMVNKDLSTLADVFLHFFKMNQTAWC